MPTQQKNVFIVQTAQSNQNGRPQGNQISLINKQSALYKYRQQKKQGGSKTSSTRVRPSPAQSLDAHQSSWLLESRVTAPTSIRGSDGSSTDSEGSPPADSDQHPDALRVSKVGPLEQRYDIDDTSHLYDCYAGLRTDPFYCMPLEDSSVVLSVSDLYTNLMIPHLSQTARVFNVQDVYLDVFWQMVFQEDTIDAVMAVTYCVDAARRRISESGAAPRKDLFVHLGNSLAKLRQKLSDLEATKIGITVSVLMYNINASRQLGNHKAVAQHMFMLRHLLKKNPDLEDLGYQGKLKPLLLQWDYFLTLNNSEDPLVPEREILRSEYPSMPLNDDLSALVSNLPNGFRKPAMAGKLSCQVLQLLSRAQEMVTAVDEGTTKSFFAKRNPDPYPDYRLALPCLDTSSEGEAGLERLICFAIFLLTTRLLSPLQRSLWSLPATGSRMAITEQVFEFSVETDAEKYCLIWIWLLGIDSWSVASGVLSVKGQQLVWRLKTRFPETSDWSYLSGIAKDFFWSEELESSCKKCWTVEM